MDNEATLIGRRICLKYETYFHVNTWYSTPSISCRDYEVFVDSEEIKTQSKPTLRKDERGDIIKKCTKISRISNNIT